MKSAFAFLLSVLALSLAATLPAQASSISYLNIISSSTIASGGSLGTITLTQNGSNEVDIDVTLTNAKFVSTGGPHHAFVFNLDLATPYTITITNPLSGFALAGSGPINMPYGAFTAGIDCPGCGPGASHAKPGPLDFKVTDASGINISDFIANGDGIFFSSDLQGPNGGTGNVAADTILEETPVPTPLPASFVLLGTSLVAFAGLSWKSRRQSMQM